MLLSVKVKPNSKKSSVTKIDDIHYEVKVDRPTRDNKANDRLVVLLSEYFDIPKSRIKITKGNKSRQKVVII